MFAQHKNFFQNPANQKLFLISEKLEDPENYATVVDDKELTNNATLYMDPMNVKP